jgi:ParB family transcriptional regulator, chromosome partitioning protein
MSAERFKSELKEIDLDLIDRNPENPRIVFRPKEMSLLIESIRQYGVQVPIAVYRDGNRFVLIDGERRWRSSIKLNKKTIPALIQAKPDPLSNLLLMFNIHALREQWDLLTIAMKLPRVIALLEGRLGRAPKDKEIAAESGLLFSVITRSKLLMALPEHHRQTILQELQKPKQMQKLTEDFFIEMERALTTVERAMPSVVQNIGRERIRETLIEKYTNGTIGNIVHFRQLAKIARADRVSADVNKAKSSIIRALSPNNVSIELAFDESVGAAYAERDVATRARSLTTHLVEIQDEHLDDNVIESLKDLKAAIQRILRAQ